MISRALQETEWVEPDAKIARDIMAVPAEGLALDMMVWTAVGLGFAILGAFWVVRGL